MLARVSWIESYRRWLHWTPLFDGQEEPSLDDLVKSIVSDEPTEAMLVGTAFHKALELAGDGEYETLSANGYTFRLPNAALELTAIRECRGFAEYGGLTVTGQVDGIFGKTIIDHKTTSKFDAEGYLAGVQWRFYLDIFGANTFRWNVFERRDVGPQEYALSEPHVLTAHRYPTLRQDCERHASAFLEFAEQHLPEDVGESLRAA
ncbi:MAG: hypothetical protein ACTHOR_01760 [Devosia sp.]